MIELCWIAEPTSSVGETLVVIQRRLKIKQIKHLLEAGHPDFVDKEKQELKSKLEGLFKEKEELEIRLERLAEKKARLVSKLERTGKEKEEEPKERKSIISFPPTENITYEKFYLNKSFSNVSKDKIIYGQALGRGGSAIVYKATYKGETIAVKKLLHLSEEQIAAFQREAIIMANHRHANIVSFRGYCPLDYALLMEYMPGGTLSRLLESTEDISWQLRYQIALDVVEGMSYLHDCGIVRSDIKSDDILLDNKRRAKIVDFGIAQLEVEGSSLELIGGTYRWMAPELFHTNISTKTAEVYSYGMVLWQLGARKQPFKTIPSLPQLANYISAGNLEIITDDTPLEIRRVIELCWLPEPPLRKETAIQQRPTIKQVRYLLEKGYVTFLSK